MYCFKMDFTIRKYRELISALQYAGYEFVTYAEYCEGRRADRLVMMRHDVDRSVERAKVLAEVENENGVRASYYFREKFIGEKSIICGLVDMGHEVGYHYEDMVTELGDIDKAYARFVYNVSKLRKLVDIRTITMHGSPMSDIDSKVMWERFNYKELGVIGEPQIDVDWTKVFYLTDTGRSWNGMSRRDKVAERVSVWKANGWVYRSTDDVIKAVREGSFPNIVMMTTHPQRWSDSIYGWVKELIMQKIKNIVKGVFIKRWE